MANISGINGHQIFYRQLAAQEPSARPPFGRQTASAEHCDTLTLSAGPCVEPDSAASVAETLQALNQAFPQITITLTGSLTAAELPQVVAGLGQGSHLLLSQDFLTRMAQSQADFRFCQQLLTAACQQLTANQGSALSTGAYLTDQELTFWSARPKETTDTLAQLLQQSQQLTSMLQKLSEKRESQQDFRLCCRPSSYSTTGQYGRLANAHSKGTVQAVLSEAHRSMASLRMVSALEGGEEQVKANRALRSLNKLLMRGHRKMKRLDQEALTKMRQKRAQRLHQDRAAGQLRQELAKKRLSRHLADGMLRQDGIRQWPSIQRWRRYDPENAQLLLGLTSPPEAVPMPSPVIAESGETFAAAEVVVSETITF